MINFNQDQRIVSHVFMHSLNLSYSKKDFTTTSKQLAMTTKVSSFYGERMIKTMWNCIVRIRLDGSLKNLKTRKNLRFLISASRCCNRCRTWLQYILRSMMLADNYYFEIKIKKIMYNIDSIWVANTYSELTL